MTWIPVRRSSSRSTGGVLLSVTQQRLRNGRTLCLVRIRLDQAVMNKAGLEIGTCAQVLRGEEEDAGKIRIRGSGDQRDGFRIARHSSRNHPGGQLSLDAALLGLEMPPPVPSTAIDFVVGAGYVDILLPRQLHPGRQRIESGVQRRGSRSADVQAPSSAGPAGKADDASPLGLLMTNRRPAHPRAERPVRARYWRRRRAGAHTRA